METSCPKCGADLAQSSGVVCPQCDHVLQPGADSRPLLAERKSRHRGSAVVLSYSIPFLATVLCLVFGGVPLLAALICGSVVGTVFLASWLLASRVTQTPGGQIIVGIVFFIGGVAVVIGLVVGGCAYLMRGMH